MMAILTGVRWWLIIVLNYIYLIICNIEYLFMLTISHLYIFFFFPLWLHYSACEILVPQTEKEPVPPEMEVQNPQRIPSVNVL